MSLLLLLQWLLQLQLLGFFLDLIARGQQDASLDNFLLFRQFSIGFPHKNRMTSAGYLKIESIEMKV